MTPGVLTPPQVEALLDILVHHETYAEVQSFQNPEAIEAYGWPFVERDEKGRPVKPHDVSSSPLLQLLLSRLVLGAPAVRDLSNEFWPVKFKGIMKQLGDADLSDSYEKGTLGTRKRLATAASVVHETITRALLTGVNSCQVLPDLQHPYNTKNAEDLERAWDDCIRHLVYENLIDEIFDQLTRTDDLEAHSPALEAAIEYAEIYIATFLYNVFVISVEGAYLLRLIENIHKLVPYTMIGQTLRVGNAASMINAMSRLFLSKVSMGAISNWIGLTSNAADGMNLMQRIISLVLEWDANDFRKAVEKIKQGEKISNEQMAAIERHLAADRKQRDQTRKKSIQEHKSIVVAIFEVEGEQILESLTDSQHTTCLEYYAAKVAIRDREHIIDVFCNSTPDLTTAIVLEGLGALDPMIRVVHKNIDLRKHLSALERFLGDFIKTTKPKTRNGNSTPSALVVKDFVWLLRRNRRLLWAYLHDFCSGCPDLRETWREWMKDVIKVFQKKPKDDPYDKNSPIHERPRTFGTCNMGPELQDSFNKLTDSQKKTVLQRIEAHSKHLSSLSEQSKSRLQKVIDELHGKSHPNPEDSLGPGIYTLRWQALLDETLITPSVPKGPLRSGKDVKGLRAARKTNDRDSGGPADTNTVKLAQHEQSMSEVVEALGPEFKRIVAEISRNGLPKA